MAWKATAENNASRFGQNPDMLTQRVPEQLQDSCLACARATGQHNPAPEMSLSALAAGLHITLPVE
jgi:hypothetical protein